LSRALLGVEPAQLLSELCQRGADLLGTQPVQGELLPVVEAQHPVPAVVDAPAIVLLVTVRAVAHLALTREGALLAAEVVEVVDARVVEAALELGREPGFVYRSFHVQ